MKYKYLLFGVDEHSGLGGMYDLIVKFNTFDDIKNCVFVDFDEFQLVETEDFSYLEFSTKIIYHDGVDDYGEIQEKRKVEFLDWIKKMLNKVY